MITDEELADLPDDPELAFVEFERIMRARLNEAIEEISQYQYGDAESFRLEYINKVIAASKEFKIEALTGWRVPDANQNIQEVYKNFQSDTDHVTMTIRIRHAPRLRKYSARLDDTTKTKIHHFIQQIRETIGDADLPVTKRDSLYDKLNTFAAEVDRTRTRLETVAAIYVDICDAIGQGFKMLEPARKWVDSIAGLLGRSKADEDSARPALPPPPKGIAPPRNRLPSPPTEPSADLDDEIPF